MNKHTKSRVQNTLLFSVFLAVISTNAKPEELFTRFTKSLWGKILTGVGMVVVY